MVPPAIAGGIAFQHPSDGGRGQSMVAMAALLLDVHEISGGHFREVCARRLRADTRDACELGRSQCAPVHHRMQHPRARRVARQRGDFRKSRMTCHVRGMWCRSH